MNFFCCHCGLRIECDDLMAGAEAACPECQGPLTVPFPVGGATESSAHVDMAEPPAPEPQRPAGIIPVGPLEMSPPAPAPPAPAPARKSVGRSIDCFFMGLVLLFCLAMAASAFRLSLLSIVFGSGIYVLAYFGFGVAILFVASLVMRGYRNAYRRYLRQSPAEFLGAFRFRGKPTEAKSSALMLGGVLLSFLAVFPLPAVGPLPAFLAAIIAFAAAFDIGQQRKLLRKLKKEGLMAEEQSAALPQAAASSSQEEEEIVRPPTAQADPRSKRRLRAIALLGGFAILLFLFFTQAWPQYQWAALRNTVKSYESFERRFPEGELGERAREKIHQLGEDEIWAAVSRHELSGRSYYFDYPDGKHRDEARRLVEQDIAEDWRRLASSHPSEFQIRSFLELNWDAQPQIVGEANALIAKLISDEWQKIAADRFPGQIENFLKRRPEAPEDVIAAAKALLAELDEGDWQRLSTAGSAEEIQDFLEKHPATSHRSALEARLDQFYDDWKWVREQDSLEHYRRFIKRFPKHPFAKWMDKRIIDLEVEEIAAGDHGEIPPVEARQVGGSKVEIEAKNDTTFELTLRYSGPDSAKLVIPPGKTGKTSLLPGAYQVTGSVASTGVLNYYGSEKLEGGSYSWNFFITYHDEGGKK